MVFLDDVAKEAADFIEMCELFAPPVNIFKILKELKIFVYYNDLPGGLDGTGIEGKPEANIRPVIILAKRRNYYRRRFTAAHELKHILFDKGERSRSDYDTRENTLEKEADSFASFCLMPDMMLNQLLDAYSEVNVTLVSRVFGVSFDAAYYRLLLNKIISRSAIDMAQFKKDDKMAFSKLKFESIPVHLRSWKILNAVLYESDLNHRRCIRCELPIFDGEKECCWGCGKSIMIYTLKDLDD